MQHILHREQHARGLKISLPPGRCNAPEVLLRMRLWTRLKWKASLMEERSGVSLSISLFPPQPGCLLLKRNGNALQARNGREANIEHRNDIVAWRKSKPLLDTW